MTSQKPNPAIPANLVAAVLADNSEKSFGELNENIFMLLFLFKFSGRSAADIASLLLKRFIILDYRFFFTRVSSVPASPLVS